MAHMKPAQCDTFQKESEKQSYELLKNLDDSCSVIYEPSLGKQKKETPDFVILSKKYGLIVLDVKYVKCDKLQENAVQTHTHKAGLKLKNIYRSVKNFAFNNQLLEELVDTTATRKRTGLKFFNFYKTVEKSASYVENHLIEELAGNPLIVHPSGKRAGKLTFPHTCGLLLYVDDVERYTKEEISRLLSLEEKDFLIINALDNEKESLENFIEALERPFKGGLSSTMQALVLGKLYMESEASASDFIDKMGEFDSSINHNFVDTLEGTLFEKNKQLKSNILEYATFSQQSIEYANKNLNFGFSNLIEELKGYKSELKDEKFTVAVFGYFSTGKSTFLNALMGSDKLPMDEDRSTATFTRLKHYEDNSGFENGDMEVVYKSRDSVEIAYKEALDALPLEEEELEKYYKTDNLEQFRDALEKRLRAIKLRDYDTSLRDSIKNAKKVVKYVLESSIPYGCKEKIAKEDIEAFLTDDEKAFFIDEVIYYLDNDLLKDIEIVDTPGYGSENTLDTFKTQEFVKQANALILLTEAKDPMSKENEHKFLETYSKIYKDDEGFVKADNLFIIANKVDASSKTPQKIRASLLERMEDNWEDSFELVEDHILTLSAKYHFEKLLDHDVNIQDYSNVNEDDLDNFVTCYCSFLTENKGKELIENSFRNIDDTIGRMQSIFKKQIDSMHEDLSSIQEKKEKFEINKDEILKTYNLYSNAINGISIKLNEDIKRKLDSQKISVEDMENYSQVQHAIKATTAVFEIFLKDKRLKSSNATKYNAKEFYTKYVQIIHRLTLNYTGAEHKHLVTEELEVINKQIEKYSTELESEYKVDGLSKELRILSLSKEELDDIAFEKGLLNVLKDIVTLGFGVKAKDYAEKMINLWNKHTYTVVTNNISKGIQHNFIKINEELEEQSNAIVKSIAMKLEEIEKSLINQKNNKEIYDAKVQKIANVFEKMDGFKATIERQKDELYGSLNC